MTFQLRALDPAGNTHTTWCHDHNDTKKAALAECKRFFPAVDGYKKHQALALQEADAEFSPEERSDPWLDKFRREAFGEMTPQEIGRTKRLVAYATQE